MRFANYEGRLTLLGGGAEDERDGAAPAPRSGAA